MFSKRLNKRDNSVSDMSPVIHRYPREGGIALFSIRGTPVVIQRIPERMRR